MDILKTFVTNTGEWDLYNGFFLHPDIERLRKFIVREHFFKMCLEIPGDIVEIGVCKGVGIAQMLKLREIFIPASNKKVVGFDLFSKSKAYKENLNINDAKLNDYYESTGISMENGISTQEISSFLDEIKCTNTRTGLKSSIYELVEGDVKDTIPTYLETNRGFRISYLYIDVDIDEPTYISLNLLYDRMVRGGVIVFDEYACEEWTESAGVDRFLDEHPELIIRTVPWARTPTAYIVKS